MNELILLEFKISDIINLSRINLNSLKWRR